LRKRTRKETAYNLPMNELTEEKLNEKDDVKNDVGFKKIYKYKYKH